MTDPILLPFEPGPFPGFEPDYWRRERQLYRMARFPARFAANDPRIPPTPKPTGKGPPIGTLLGRAAPGVLAGAAVLAELIAEDVIRKREQDIEGGFDALKRKKARLQREKELREVLVRGQVAGLPPDQLPQRPAAIPEVPLQRPPAAAPSVFRGSRGLEVDVVRPKLDEPVIAPPKLPEPGSGQIPDFARGTATVTLPETLPEPTTAADVASDIASEIGQEIATQGLPQNVFGQPSPITFAGPQGLPQPVTFGVPQPLVWGTPGLTPPKAAPVQSLFQDPFGQVLDFPEPIPNPATDPARQRRCKPCKEDNPKPREQCYKGLYREGPMDTQVDYVEWAEIDCVTGVEL